MYAKRRPRVRLVDANSPVVLLVVPAQRPHNRRINHLTRTVHGTLALQGPAALGAITASSEAPLVAAPIPATVRPEEAACTRPLLVPIRHSARRWSRSATSSETSGLGGSVVVPTPAELVCLVTNVLKSTIASNTASTSKISVISLVGGLRVLSETIRCIGPDRK
jgi:hypothetical protein